MAMRQVLTLGLFMSFFFNNHLCISLEGRIDELLRTTNRPFNGVILIAIGSTPLYERVVGDMGAPQLHSQFIIGSISKQITTVAIMQAVEKGILDLNAPISAYLPRLEDEWAKDVSLHHLLNHTSGIEAEGKPLLFKPGEKFAYSNLGYDLLGEILESATPKSYKDAVHTIFLTAGMASSAIPESGTIAALQKSYPNLLTGFLEFEDKGPSLAKTPRNAASNPSGGLISTAHDLLKWNIALHDDKKLLSPEMYERMVTPSSERENRWGKIKYGYGVHISQSDEILEISHSGVIEGYLSTLFYYPKSKVSVIMLENNVFWPKNWDIDSQKRIFKTHDQIRSIVRNTGVVN